MQIGGTKIYETRGDAPASYPKNLKLFLEQETAAF